MRMHLPRKHRGRRREQGTAVLEFALAGIPLLLMIISIFELCLAMWSYHTLAFAVREGARYAAIKGQGCSYTGNSCGVTVGTIAQQIATAGAGLSPAVLNVTLTSAAGSISCNPLNSCYSNTTAWPPSSSSANVAGSAITVSGTYAVNTSLVFLFIPTGSLKIGNLTLPASSQQLIQF